jgi:hypothetical protein
LTRRFLLYVAAALAATAVILAVSGGFRTTVGGLRVSARSPLPIAFLAFVNGSLWYLRARREKAIESDLEAAWEGINRHSLPILAIAFASASVAAIFSTRSAAGADASGYLSQAFMWWHGAWFFNEPLAIDLNAVDGWLATPLGWRPKIAALQSPTYPPGLPLLMAIPHGLAGAAGAFVVVIASAAVGVIATGMLASQLAGRVAGVIAASLIAFAPVFLYQSIQPMSDVPVTAAWMLCFLLAHRGRATWAGTACAAAVLIRPNLAPLAIAPLLSMAAQKRIAFAVPVAIAGGFLAGMQFLWYGSPLRSGYGSAAELFAISNVGANASRYFSWLIATSPALLLAVFGFWRMRSSRTVRAMSAFAVLVIAAYLIYAVFDTWSYLRFLLPALAVFAVLAAAELAAWIDKWPVRVRAAVLFALLLGVTAHGLFVARLNDAFKLSDQLRRVARVADFINSGVEASAVILSGEQSGSMRYYTHRSILRWEAATADTLAAAVATLEQQGRPVYVVLDAWENERLRAKFPAVPLAALDWPPILEAGTTHRTRLWKLSDRDRFLRGERLNIIRLP